jgi:predicted small lipoprotein YifL
LGPATLLGSTLTITGAGTVVLSVAQAASGSYAAATQNASFNVAVEVPALVFAAIALENSDSIPFTVSASSPSAGALTYLVVSGPATIAGSTLTQTGAGTVVLSVNQAAAGSYGAASATISFIVTPGFTLGSSTGSSGIASTVPGGLATFVLTLSPGSGTTFPDAMTFSIAGMPSGANATFSPSAIAAGSGVTTVTVTIQTASGQASNRNDSFPGAPAIPVAVGLLLPWLGLKRARRELRKMGRFSFAALVLFGALAALAGCSSASPTYPPPQAYVVAVTATDAVTGAHAAIDLALTVQ